MKKEIGSEFYLDRYENLEDKPINFNHLGLCIADTAFISTGRNAISFILEQIKIPQDEKIALLPAFTCYTVIEPFIDAGYSINFYSINRDMTYDREMFLEELERVKPCVVLVHGYFGFDTLKPIKNILKHIKMKGTIVIEDITQTLYSDIRFSDVDYYVFSFRKWLAIPDGGCVISSKKTFSFKPFKVDIALQEKKLEAFHAKYLYITRDIGVKDDFLKLFYEADRILGNQSTIYAMSPTSKMIQSNADIEFLKLRRRKNYEVLLRGLSDIKAIDLIFDKLGENIVPLYFPFYVKSDRAELQSYLAKNDIYAPIVWPKSSHCEGLIDEESEWIYRHILVLPCDQRYDISDMEKIIRVMKDYDCILSQEEISVKV